MSGLLYSDLINSTPTQGHSLSIRELEPRDVDSFIRYWTDAQPDLLLLMGVDKTNVPDELAWRSILTEQLSQPVTERKSCTLIWELNHKPIGHSNINKIVFGQEAFRHLHLWDTTTRQKE